MPAPHQFQIFTLTHSVLRFQGLLFPHQYPRFYLFHHNNAPWTSISPTSPGRRSGTQASSQRNSFFEITFDAQQHPRTHYHRYHNFLQCRQQSSRTSVRPPRQRQNLANLSEKTQIGCLTRSWTHDDFERHIILNIHLHILDRLLTPQQHLNNTAATQLIALVPLLSTTPFNHISSPHPTPPSSHSSSYMIKLVPSRLHQYLIQYHRTGPVHQ